MEGSRVGSAGCAYGRRKQIGSVEAMLCHTKRGGKILHIFRLPLYLHTVYLQVTARIQDDIMTMLIPTVTVPLDPRVCMCQSLQSVAQDIHLPQIQFSCTRNTTCNRVHCQFSSYALDITFDPCSEAIQLTAHSSDGRLVYQRTFNDSQNVTINLPSSVSSFLGTTATLNVIIVHHNYSMEIEVSSYSRGAGSSLSHTHFTLSCFSPVC